MKKIVFFNLSFFVILLKYLNLFFKFAVTNTFFEVGQEVMPTAWNPEPIWRVEYICLVFSSLSIQKSFLLSSFCRMIYYLDPSVLSAVSCFVMFLCLADYLVPALAPRIFGSNKWW